VTSQVSWNDEEALLADPHHLMLLILAEKFWHSSCWLLAHVLVKYVVDLVPMEAPSPWKITWYSPSGHLQQQQEQSPEGLCSDGLLGI
jgi:hypothetical protein